jgi:hypothetical protein
MRCTSTLTFGLLLLAFAGGAGAEVQADFEIAELGKVRVRYEPSPPAPAQADYGTGHLRFYLEGAMASFLSVPTEVDSIEPFLDVWDVNGDGHKDVVFYRQKSGYGGSPTRGGDVLLYVPRLRTFVKSQTLSERGELSAGNRKGCVKVEYKSGPSGYAREQWCFAQEKGRWRMVGREVDPE